MRIAMVFDGLGFGGIERVGVRYVELLTSLGHYVDVYNLQGDACAFEGELPRGCVVRHVKLPLVAVPYQWSFLAKRWWWGKYLYPLTYLASKVLLFGLKVLYRVNGKGISYDLAIAFSGHLRDLAFVATGFVRSRKQLAWLHGALLEYLLLTPAFGDVYSKIVNLCVLSTDRQETALQACAYLRDKLHITRLYNPIDLYDNMPDSAEAGRLRAKFGDYILMVGRLGADKDQETVIRARKILEDRYNKSPHVVFVGGGPMLGRLEAVARQLGLENAVFFAGAQYNVQDYYASAHLFVHSSSSEGLPTVLLESMKYGLPIVATDSPPGVSEILGNDEYGLRCKVGDAEDMAEKINYMLEDVGLRDRYIQAGRERVRRFSCETIKVELEHMLDSLQ